MEVVASCGIKTPLSRPIIRLCSVLVSFWHLGSCTFCKRPPGRPPHIEAQAAGRSCHRSLVAFAPAVRGRSVGLGAS